MYISSKMLHIWFHESKKKKKKMQECREARCFYNNPAELVMQRVDSTSKKRRYLACYLMTLVSLS